MSTLADRVLALMRQQAPAPLSERDAVQRLRPHGQGVQGTLIDPPLNRRHPAVEPGGARREPILDGRDSTV